MPDDLIRKRSSILPRSNHLHLLRIPENEVFPKLRVVRRFRKLLECLTAEGRSKLKWKLNCDEGPILLFYAVLSKDISLAEVLTDAGADFNLLDEKSRSALHVAVELNNHDNTAKSILSWLLGRDDVNVNAQDHLGRTPLHYAAKNGDEAAVDLLLMAKRIKPNISDMDQMLPLHYACKFDRIDLIRVLLNDMWKRKDELRWNLLTFTKRTPLHLAAMNGNAKLVADLLSHSVCNKWKLFDIDQEDNDGLTALAYAAKNENAETCRILIDHGAICETAEKLGESLLIAAAPRETKLLHENQSITKVVNKKHEQLLQQITTMKVRKHLHKIYKKCIWCCQATCF